MARKVSFGTAPENQEYEKGMKRNIVNSTHKSLNMVKLENDAGMGP